MWVSRNTHRSGAGRAGASDLLERVNSEDDPEQLARFADEDATRKLHRRIRADVDARLQAVEADWRAWLLTGDRSWRSLAFAAARRKPDFPVAHLPTT